MDDPVFYVSGHNDDENKDDNNDDTQGLSTVPYPRAISEYLSSAFKHKYVFFPNLSILWKK